MEEQTNTFPLTLNLSHEWDDESDTQTKSSIQAHLLSSSKTAFDVANDITLTISPHDNLGGFLDQTQDVFIYTSKFLPYNHITQDRLVDVVRAVRGLGVREGQPAWCYFFEGPDCGALIEAQGAQDLCRLETETDRQHWRNLSAFMARLTRDELSQCPCIASYAFTQTLEVEKPGLGTRLLNLEIVYDWLRLAGKELVLRAKESDSRARGELWDRQGRPGYSRERWEFWGRRLREIEGDEGEGVEVREVAGKAGSILEGLLG